MKTIDRRQFFRGMSVTGVTVLSIRLVGCGPSQDESQVLSEVTVAMRDIRMEGWSTLGSGFLGENGVLKATVVKENKTVVLSYIQDPHGHKFTLTPDHFAKLRKGEKVEVLTTEALGHRHKVVINPTRVVQNSSPVEMPVEIPNGDLQLPPPVPPPPLPPDSTEDRSDVFAMITEGNDPDLYLSVPDDLAGAELKYCLDTKEVCDSDESKWTKANFYRARDGMQFFLGQEKLALGGRVSDAPLQIKGNVGVRFFRRDAKLQKIN